MLRADEKGFTLVEMLIAMAITLISIGAMLIAFTNSIRVFKDVKTMSENIDTRTPAMEFLDKYFDRWGAGLTDNTSATACSTSAYPNVRAKCMVKNAGSPCDNVSFFGNFSGIAFVRNVNGGTATLVNCRLDNSSCVNLWRSNAIKNTVPLRLDNWSQSGSNCLTYNSSTNTVGINSSNTSNATVNYIPDNVSGSAITDNNSYLQAGDILQRSPQWMTLYCASNANDNNQQWLYASLSEVPPASSYAACGTTSVIPIAPAYGFGVTPSPSGCGTTTPCTSVSITVNYRSQSKKYANVYDNYSATRVYGR